MQSQAPIGTHTRDRERQRGGKGESGGLPHVLAIAVAHTHTHILHKLKNYWQAQSQQPLRAAPAVSLPAPPLTGAHGIITCDKYLYGNVMSSLHRPSSPHACLPFPFVPCCHLGRLAQLMSPHPLGLINVLRRGGFEGGRSSH